MRFGNICCDFSQKNQSTDEQIISIYPENSTGDWAISNDTLGRIQTATGHGITTTHSHDTFGNKISHSASPTPATMINWSFPALTNYTAISMAPGAMIMILAGAVATFGVEAGGGSGPANTTTQDIDKAVCEAYKALAAKFGGIPTGQTEVGAKIYIENNKVRISEFAEHKALPGKSLTVNLGNLDGAFGYIHTHPSTHTQYDDGKKIPLSDLARSNVSLGDFDYLAHFKKMANGLNYGYVTSPKFWDKGQIIRFTADRRGIPQGYDFVDCNKYLSKR